MLHGNTVWEGAAVGTLVGTFSTSGDPEAGQTFSYSLVSGDGSADNGKFTIDGNQLKIAVVPDFATQYALLHPRAQHRQRRPGAVRREAVCHHMCSTTRC